MTSNRFLFGFALFIASLHSGRALSHGEDQLGPHGGAIRMPGAFHTELVKKSSNEVQIYLLDMNWKNPVVKETRLSALVLRAKNEIPLSCKVKEISYLCTAPKTFKFQAGDEVVVQSERQSAPGVSVRYVYPFIAHP